MNLINCIALAVGYSTCLIILVLGFLYVAPAVFALLRWVSPWGRERPWQILKNQRFVHTKRGSSYVLIGEGRLQTADPLTDMAALVAYRDEKTGEWWFRPVDEFDMRFEFEGMAR